MPFAFCYLSFPFVFQLLLVELFQLAFFPCHLCVISFFVSEALACTLYFHDLSPLSSSSSSSLSIGTFSSRSLYPNTVQPQAHLSYDLCDLIASFVSPHCQHCFLLYFHFWFVSLLWPQIPSLISSIILVQLLISPMSGITIAGKIDWAVRFVLSLDRILSQPSPSFFLLFFLLCSFVVIISQLLFSCFFISFQGTFSLPRLIASLKLCRFHFRALLVLFRQSFPSILLGTPPPSQ